MKARNYFLQHQKLDDDDGGDEDDDEDGDEAATIINLILSKVLASNQHNGTTHKHTH